MEIRLPEILPFHPRNIINLKIELPLENRKKSLFTSISFSSRSANSFALGTIAKQ